MSFFLLDFAEKKMEHGKGKEGLGQETTRTGNGETDGNQWSAERVARIE